MGYQAEQENPPPPSTSSPETDEHPEDDMIHFERHRRYGLHHPDKHTCPYDELADGGDTAEKWAHGTKQLMLDGAVC